MTSPHAVPSVARPSGRPLTTLPGPRGLPLLGNLLQLKATQLPTILERWADRYGPLYTFRLGRKPVVVVAEPALIQTVLRHRPETYRRLHTIAAAFDDLGGQGVFTAEGAHWRRQRRVVMPALSAPQVRQFFPTLTAVTTRLKTRWARAARAGEVVDIPTELMRYTAEVTTRFTFGDDLPALDHGGEGLRAVSGADPADDQSSVPGPRAVLACLPPPGGSCVCTGPGRAPHGDGRRPGTGARASGAGPSQGPPPRRTVLEALLVARDAEGRAWSDDEILSNLLTMLVAGEDTTAHTMAWMLHFMTDVPAVQQAMQQEADAVLGAARMLPDVQTQDQLPYIDAVAQETMRLKSVAPLLFVEPTHAVDLGGIHLPAGTAVFLLTRHGGLHEHAFPDAAQFQPARWLTAPLEPTRGPTPQILVPFGGGPRVCPGRTLAWLEIKTVMAMLCRNFTLTKPVGAPPVREHFAFTLMPTPLRLQLRPRA